MGAKNCPDAVNVDFDKLHDAVFHSKLLYKLTYKLAIIHMIKEHKHSLVGNKWIAENVKIIFGV